MEYSKEWKDRKRKTKKDRKINEKRHSHNMKFNHNHKTKAKNYMDIFLLLFNSLYIVTLKALMFLELRKKQQINMWF